MKCEQTHRYEGDVRRLDKDVRVVGDFCVERYFVPHDHFRLVQPGLEEDVFAGDTAEPMACMMQFSLHWLLHMKTRTHGSRGVHTWTRVSIR